MHFQQFLHRRGIVVVISDFYEEPETIIKTVEPLRFHGNEVILFHVLDPQEIAPKLSEPVLLLDMETKTPWKCRRNTRSTNTGSKIDAHIEELRNQAQRAGHGLFPGATPAVRSTRALREYLNIRQGRR